MHQDGTHCAASWAHPGTTNPLLAPSWTKLGATVPHLGPILAPSGAIWGPVSRILGPSCGHPGPPWATMGPAWGQERHPESHLASPEGHREQTNHVSITFFDPITNQSRICQGALGPKSPCDHARFPHKTLRMPRRLSSIRCHCFIVGPSGGLWLAILIHLGTTWWPSWPTLGHHGT